MRRVFSIFVSATRIRNNDRQNERCAVFVLCFYRVPFSETHAVAKKCLWRWIYGSADFPQNLVSPTQVVQFSQNLLKYRSPYCGNWWKFKTGFSDQSEMWLPKTSTEISHMFIHNLVLLDLPAAHKWTEQLWALHFCTYYYVCLDVCAWWNESTRSYRMLDLLVGLKKGLLADAQHTAGHGKTIGLSLDCRRDRGGADDDGSGGKGRDTGRIPYFG